MGLEVFYRDTDGTLVGPVTQLGVERLRSFVTDVTENAEEGAVANSRVPIDDINGDLTIPGLRLIGVTENQASTTDKYIFAGYTTDRIVKRGDNFRTGAARLWDVGVVDGNTILESRVIIGASANRPAETDVERVTWLLSITDGPGGLIGDSRYFSTANPEPMDAVDYRGQTFKAILDDCAQQSGKNYFITYFEDTATANLPWGVFSLWYDFTNSTSYSSTIRLSNSLADIDSSTTFAISQENTQLLRDPSRVFSGMYVPYDGGAAYVQYNPTKLNFMVRDGTAPAQNVKTATKANRRGNRMLADVATEEDVITTEFQVPAADVNQLRAGMRVRFRATHLPGYETPVWLRVLTRTVTQDSEATYKIRVEMSSTGVTADNVGETIGGYLCTETGYHVPVDAGDFGPMKSNNCTYSWSDSPANGGAQPLNYGRCLLYTGATYAYVYHVDHGLSNCLVRPRIASLGGGSLLGDEPMGCVCPCCVEEYRTDASGQFTIPAANPVSSAYYELVVQHQSYAGCSPNGVIGTANLSYVSGPDPRFESLEGCPFP